MLLDYFHLQTYRLILTIQGTEPLYPIAEVNATILRYSLPQEKEPVIFYWCTHIYLQTNTHTHTYIHIYIHIYMHIQVIGVIYNNLIHLYLRVELYLKPD